MDQHDNFYVIVGLILLEKIRKKQPSYIFSLYMLYHHVALQCVNRTTGSSHGSK